MDQKHQELIEKRKALEIQESQLLRQLNKAEQRKSYLDSSTRKQRTHRLVTRGAAIESLIPETKDLTEVEFYSAAEAFFEDTEIRQLFLDHLSSVKVQKEGRKD